MEHAKIFADVYQRIDELEKQKTLWEGQQKEIESLIENPNCDDFDKKRFTRMLNLIHERKKQIIESLQQIHEELKRITESVSVRQFIMDLTMERINEEGQTP